MKPFKFERVAPSEGFLNSSMWRYCVESAFPANRNIGLELELEGFGAEMMGMHATGESRIWVAHNDPSLRGDATELVLRQPVSYEELVNKALPEFTHFKKKSGFKANISNRCSVHVHLDFAHHTVYSLCKFVTLYALYEDFFFRACGPERRGNHFCIALSENSRFSSQFVKALETQNFREFSGEGMRYMALNLQSLWKFGSVEVRLHEGTDDEARILQWVTVLTELVEFACKNFAFTPDDILRQASIAGLDEFTRANLPSVWKLIAPVYYNSYQHTDTAQDFAFGVSWANAPTGADKALEAKKSKSKTAGTRGEAKAVDLDELFREHAMREQRAVNPAAEVRIIGDAPQVEWRHINWAPNPARVVNPRKIKINPPPRPEEDDNF